MKKVNMYINGEWVDSLLGETFRDMNPFTGELFAEVPKGNVDDADKALEAAFKARKLWAGTSPSDRAKILYKASALVIERQAELADVLIHESGATFGKAMFETEYVSGLLHTAGEDCRRILGETYPTEHDKFGMTVYRPLGTVVAISPWNFPLLLSCNKVAYGLAAGNTVILKPASETPAIGLKIAEIFEDAGLPPGVLNVITGPGGVLGDKMIEDPRSSLISFTGETVTGRKIGERAGRNLKKFTLELGGKDPLIILGDADLDYAVNAAAFGAFMHQGQICMSVERIIVEESIAEEFAANLAKKAKELPVGDPAQPTTVIGPLINDTQVQTVHAHVQDAIEKGATVLSGGKYENRLYYPTVLSGVTRDMRIFKEETFGPVAPVIAVKDEQEALEVANDTVYGLSSGVITNDLQKGFFLAENLEAGMVHINDAGVNDDPYCPFGGCKASGIGREGGRHSMEEMSELKWITLQKGQKQYPF